jgi:hypothetical protein
MKDYTLKKKFYHFSEEKIYFQQRISKKKKKKKLKFLCTLISFSFTSYRNIQKISKFFINLFEGFLDGILFELKRI